MARPVYYDPPGPCARYCPACHRIAVQPDQHQCPKEER